MLTRKQIQVSNDNGSVIANRFFWNLSGAIIVKYVGTSIEVEKSTALDLLVVGVKGPKILQGDHSGCAKPPFDIKT